MQKMDCKKKKRRRKSGFTLIEMLAAIVVMILITAALSVGIPATMNAYQEMKAVSESTVLLSTLSQSLTDELRYARDVKLQSSDNLTLASFTSSIYGLDVKPVSHEGKIEMVYTRVPPGGGAPVSTYYPLVNDAVYTNDLAIGLSDITYDGQVFYLELTVYQPLGTTSFAEEDQILTTLELAVRTVNE